ncbi:MAG: carboxypeptidase regulatory-like domain-containing protein [Bacteroidetes bacterium]|nr:carboxypeptidase regulatory-like domain-containing protein [Bacteroidota bacterium]
MIFHAGMAMLNDGQKIFMNEPEILTKFIFQNLLALINPAIAGIRGTVKEIDTNMAIADAQISAQKDGETAINVSVDADGVFGQQLAEGHYKITVSADGYVAQTFDMDLKLTGLKGLNVVMEKVV